MVIEDLGGITEIKRCNIDSQIKSACSEYRAGVLITKVASSEIRTFMFLISGLRFNLEIKV